eukprot:TRINITY_DN1932_c0_g1_i1.p1 TRINITY_DN1932_c0_g1~~TRINITY_DN1932_c0_g1_i1.p1  ORF type:complete len:167 (-),score=0.03 TRINITY_DN1932_c0_g1_i1:624-1124(-)
MSYAFANLRLTLTLRSRTILPYNRTNTSAAWYGMTRKRKAQQHLRLRRPQVMCMEHNTPASHCIDSGDWVQRMHLSQEPQEPQAPSPIQQQPFALKLLVKNHTNARQVCHTCQHGSFLHESLAYLQDQLYLNNLRHLHPFSNTHALTLLTSGCTNARQVCYTYLPA